MKFSDMSIRALKPPEKGAVIHYDDTLPGFGVRTTARGIQSYILTHGPRRTRETIGRVGILRLQDARQEAKRVLAEYTLGKQRPQTKSWLVALAEYLAEIKANRRASTYKSYNRHLHKHFPFGDTRMSEISPHELQRDLDKLKDRPAELHHAYVYLRAFIKWAHRKHYLDTNPMERMKTPEGSKSRERILTDTELVKVWRACPNDPFGRIVKLLILMGQRLGETSSISPNMMSDDTITFPAELTKNGRSHIIPVPATAKPYLHHLTYGGFSKAKERLDIASGVSGWTLHDLRRTYASKLASLGVALPVIERILNHVSGSFSGVAGVYNRYDFLPEMKDASLKFEHYLLKLLKT